MKRSYIISAIVAVVVLAGAGLASFFLVSNKEAAKTPAPQQMTTQPAATPNKQQDPVATVSPALPPLPAENTQAIDSEIDGIDKELTRVDSSLASDPTDEELGL